MKPTFYISTGALECFYTLRKSFDEIIPFRTEGGELDSHVVSRDYHLRNLSTDRDEAVAKAREITGLGLDAEFEVREINRSETPIDWSILQGGKHSGVSVAELAESARGKEYLVWLIENCATSKTYAKTVELARAYVAHELASKSAALAAAVEAKRERAFAQARAFGREFCAALREVPGFAGNIVRGWVAGRPVHGRALDVMIEIAARSCGRRGSKAFEARVAELKKILEIG